MPHEVIMPQLGMAQDSGVVVAWRKSVGDAVEPDDVLMEVETDKAVMEVPAGVRGYLAEIRTAPGEEAAIGEIVAIVAETPGASDAVDRSRSPTNRSPSVPDARISAPVPSSEAPPRALTKGLPASDGGQFEGRGHGGRRVLASPKARRIARERGIDLDALVEQGMRQPVRAADLDRPAEHLVAGAPSLRDVDPGAWGPVEAAPVSPIDRISKERMASDWNAVVPGSHRDMADMTEIKAMQARLRPEDDEDGELLPDMAFFVKALAAALAEHPRFNASLSPDGSTLWMKRYFNIGVAVHTDQGTVVPVIRGADRKGIRAVAAEIRDLAVRAQDGAIQPEDLGGGSMSISRLSNTGFTPIVKTPEAAVMGIGRTDTRPVWDGQAFLPRPMATIELTFDRRIVDDAQAARFLGGFRRIVELPALLLL